MTIHKDGICPVCGSDMLDYGSVEFDDECIVYPVQCIDCGAEFNTVYSLRFECHEKIVPATQETYEVFVTKTVTVKVEVTARDEEEAEAKALEQVTFDDKNANYLTEVQQKEE